MVIFWGAFYCFPISTGSREHQRARTAAQGPVPATQHSTGFPGTTRLLPASIQKAS